MADGEIIVDIEVGTDKAEKKLNDFMDRVRKSFKSIEIIKVDTVDLSAAVKSLREFVDNIKPINLKFEADESLSQMYDNINEKLKEYVRLLKKKDELESKSKHKSILSELISHLDVVNNRIFNLLKSAFIFNVMSKGFRLISNEVGLLINRDSMLSQSLLIIRANLINAFLPIMRVVLPWIRALGDWLVWLSQKLVEFVNFITGGNAKVVSSVSEAQSTIDDYNVVLGNIEDVKEPDVFQGISNDAIQAGSAIGRVADKTGLAIDAIRRVASRLPKVSNNVKKLRDELAPFDKIKLLKSEKNGYYDLVNALSPEGLMNNVSNKLPSYKAGKIGGIKSGRIKGPKGGGISGKMPKIDKLALPKIEFDVDPNSLALLEKLKGWLDENSDAAKLLKASFVALATYLGSKAFISALNNIFGLSLAGKWAGPLALGVGAGYFLYNFFKDTFTELNEDLQEGWEAAQQRLKDHPEWVGDYIDEQGYRKRLLPGESLADIHDSDLLYILTLEEKGRKEVAERKEKVARGEKLGWWDSIQEKGWIATIKDKYLDEDDRKRVESQGWWATIKEDFISLADKPKKFFQDVVKGINEVSKNVNTTTFEDLENLDNKISTTHTGITDLFKTTGKQIEISSKDIGDWVSTSWESLKTKVIEISDKIKTFFEDLGKNIGETKDKILNWVSTGWENLKSAINDCISKSNTFFSQLSTNTNESLENFKKWTSKMWDNFLDFTSKLGKELSDSLTTAWDNIKKWFGDIGKFVTDKFTNLFSGDPNVSNVEIPHLAQGAVLRGGDPFLSYINDQPRGQTNIETPLSTMVEAFKIAMSESQPRTPNIVLNATGNMAQFIRLLNIQLSEEDARVGTSMVSFGG